MGGRTSKPVGVATAKATAAEAVVGFAGRIEALLLPQNWKDSELWNKECDQLIADLRVSGSDPRCNVLVPDLTQWVGVMRPQWTSYDVILPKGMEFINPLFAWLGIAMWPKATDANVSGLFDVLMRGGCGSAIALGAVTSTGRVVLQFAAAAAYAARWTSDPTTKRALHLLIAERNLPLLSSTSAATDPDQVVDGNSGPFCCALCTTMYYKLDDAAVNLLSRLTPAQRLAAVSAPHWAFSRACKYSCSRTFVALWNVVHDRMVQPDCGAAELDSIIGGPMYHDGYFTSAFATAAVVGDARVWRLVTNVHCPLAAALLRHTNVHPRRQYISPLRVLSATDQTDNEGDLRGAWLVPRLCADVLNAYDDCGFTSVMRAAQYAYPKTLAALLDRGVEIDLCAQPIKCKPTTLVIADMLARADTQFAAETAADLLPDVDEEKLMTVQFLPIAVRLRTETKAQMALRPLIAAAMVPALQQFGGAQFPRELASLCLAYADLPQPAVSTSLADTTPRV